MDNKIGFLFDLDGVLIDSEREYTCIWGAINVAFPTGVENFPIVIKGQTLPEILSRYFREEDRHAVTDMLNERESKMKYDYLPGAREFLEELAQRGLPRVLVTSSNEMKMRHLREERPELEGMFSDIVTADRISRSKPDPEGYLLGAKLIGVKPERCAVFEDSLQGVQAGHAAGAYTVGLTTTLPAEKIAPFCDKIIPDLSAVDLDSLIKTLEGR